MLKAKIGHDFSGEKGHLLISRRSFTSYCSTGTLCLGMYEKTANVFGGLLSFSGENENEDSLF